MPQNGGSLKMHLVITLRGILCFDSQLRDNELVCRKDSAGRVRSVAVASYSCFLGCELLLLLVASYSCPWLRALLPVACPAGCELLLPRVAKLLLPTSCKLLLSKAARTTRPTAMGCHPQVTPSS